jgi:hypothetical protein
MGGSRHSKNAAGMGSEGLNYHERRAMHFGTQTERLGKVSVAMSQACEKICWAGGGAARVLA